MDKVVLMSKLADVLQTNSADLTEEFALTAENWDSVHFLALLRLLMKFTISLFLSTS